MDTLISQLLYMHYYEYCRWIIFQKNRHFLLRRVRKWRMLRSTTASDKLMRKEIISLSGRVTGLNEHFPKLQDHWNNDRLPFFRFLTRKSAPFVMRPRWNQQCHVLVTCARILIIYLHRKGLWEDLSILLGCLQIKLPHFENVLPIPPDLHKKKPPRSFGE